MKRILIILVLLIGLNSAALAAGLKKPAEAKPETAAGTQASIFYAENNIDKIN
jgi:opacity protein-like surface antigen